MIICGASFRAPSTSPLPSSSAPSWLSSPLPSSPSWLAFARALPASASERCAQELPPPQALPLRRSPAPLPRRLPLDRRRRAPIVPLPRLLQNRGARSLLRCRGTSRRTCLSSVGSGLSGDSSPRSFNRSLGSLSRRKVNPPKTAVNHAEMLRDGTSISLNRKDLRLSRSYVEPVSHFQPPAGQERIFLLDGIHCGSVLVCDGPKRLSRTHLVFDLRMRS